jgi:hypothetical protein
MTYSSTEDKAKCVSIATVEKKECVVKEKEKEKEPRKSVSTMLMFFPLCVVLAVVLHILHDYECSKEFIICIGIAGIVLILLLCFAVKFSLYQYYLSHNESPGIQKTRAIWRTIGYVVAIHIIVGFSIIYYYRCRFVTCSDTNPNGPDKTVENINKQLLLLKVESSVLRFCQPVQLPKYTPYGHMRASFVQPVLAEQPKSQFVISVKDNARIPFYLFEATEYTLDTGGFRPPAAGQICRYIDDCYDEKDPILGSVRKGQAGISRSGCLSVPVDDATIELAYIIRKLSKIPCSRIEILIKGYADGQGSDWWRLVKPGRHAYRDFRIYRKYKREESGYFEDLYYPDTYYVDEFYTNKDLPNLRAMFVKQYLIEPFISQCNMSPSVAAYVIDGQEIPGIDPLNRMVQIYILLF